MADRALDVYLNDHLAGAMLGSDLARQIEKLAAGTPLETVMSALAAEIEEDRETLVGLMERLEISKNPVKQVTGWVAEKASRVKFSGLGSGEPEQGMFMALESLRLGVFGKGGMWKVLIDVKDQYPALASTDLEGLLARADQQQARLERERIAAGRRALAAEPVS